MLKEKWDNFSEDYDDKVYSITKFPIRRKQIIDNLDPGKILNIGCGSAPHLNNDLIKYGQVIATDFCEEMIKNAQKNFQHENIEYLVADTRNLPFQDNEFESVVSANSILPPNREHITEMAQEIYRTLKYDGVFVGFLPSFDCTSEIDVEKWGVKVDKKNKREWDTTGWQCFHTPETINDEIISAGFRRYNIEKVYFDTVEEISELKRLYGIDSSKPPIHEYLLVAIK